MAQLERNVAWCLLATAALFTSGVRANLPPSFTDDMNLHVVSEDTPIGAAVYTLKASDPEGGSVSYGLSGSDRLRVDSRTGVVTVQRALDRETNDTLRLVVTVEDEVPGGNNNIVRVPISLIVLDTNDNPPVFLQTPYEAIVNEDAVVGSTVLPGIRLTDQDQVGDVIKVECHPITPGGDGCEVFSIVPSRATSREYSGNIVLNKPLQYSSNNIYQLKLVATDGGEMASVGVVIRVRDVQNSPPAFTGSLTGIVTEDDPIGTKVMTLKAADGDTGAPRSVEYELITNPLDFFTLDAETGELRTAKPLDREALQSPDGVVKVKVKAYEVQSGEAVGSPDTETVVDVTITIRDVNDEPPTFNRREYRATVPENVPDGTPLPNLDMFVQDTDVGSNSVFSLRLLDASGIFSVEPGVASGSSSVSIRVARGPLDFENPNQRKFLLQVIAEETLTNPRLSSTATVVVSVTDTNDNPPQFAQEAYTATVSETASPGTVVTTIVASDRDTGQFGADGIKYSLFGNGAEKFEVDETSGVITVAFCDTPGHGNCLDYEERPTYFLSFQATDAGGEGHTTVVPVRVSLADSNDNPPKFTRQQYRAVIDEGAADFDPPLTVNAEDPDATSQITYSLVGGDPTGLFIIDSKSGRIRVANESGLDISDLSSDQIILTVEANDGEGSHTANVRVSVRDANNSPVFSKNLYVAQVQENSAPDSLVEQVSASDADTGANAQITYGIQRGGYDDFAISSETGEVTVARKLDYDKRQSYEIVVVASDGGIPRLTSTSTLTVSVINNNDKSPYFTPTTQRTQVSEDVAPGTTFHTLSAKDPDVVGDVGLVFGVELPVSAVDADGQLVEGPARDVLAEMFVIDPATGTVTVAGQLDRTMATEVTFDVTVTDVSATPPQVGLGHLVITIVDVNDFPPIFPPPWSPESPSIQVTVAEELPRGSLLTTITASDVDSNIGGYSLANSSEHFALDNATGVVTVKSRLDYETQPELSFVVVAHDTGVPTLSATTTVIVKLENINDEEPVFSEAVYDAEVAENSPPGTSVITVKATDADKGEFGVVSYSLAGDHHEHFAIDSDGLVTVRNGALLDREMLAGVVLRVVATDTAPENQRRQSSVPLHIVITDMNDHGPAFSQKSYSASVVENLPVEPAAPIVQVTAHDNDEGINSLIRYVVTEGNDEGAFYLDPQSGILYPAKELLAEQTKYNLTIEARDLNGTGEFSDVATVEITVLPQNQHKPKFVSPALPNATVPVQENWSSAVQQVIVVEAEDKDTGANGEIRYHIRIGEENLQDTPEFHLDPITGVLSTKQVLDREEQHKYELVLVAKDQGSPISYETLRFLTILVEDVNDNRPVFPKNDMSPQAYRFSVVENAAKHTLIGQLAAMDPDAGINAKIFYYFVAGNDHESFYLDKLHGNLYTNAVLDREQNSSYALVVKATNDPNFIIDPSQGVVYDETDPTIAIVTVAIEDENDTPPRFISDVYYAGVSHEAEVDRFIRMVRAVDGDAGLNGTLSYSIRASNLFRPSEAKSIGSIIPSPFNITQDGKLTTSSLMAQYRRHRFILQIQAKEEAPPYRAAKCNVNIWVWEREDLVRVVLALPPEKVVKGQEEIAATLSKVTGGTAVVDEIRYHVDADNTVKHDRTDMLVHVVKRSDQVMAVPDVLKKFDEGYATLRNNSHTFFIDNVFPATIEAMEDEVDARLAGLIALMVVLFIGFISFIVVCCCLRYWVMTPSSRSSEHLIKRNIDEDLGLNTTENPLWVDQKLKMYEEQELTMQVMSEFDTTQVNGQANAGQVPSVTVDAEWSPERRASSIDLSQMDGQSNTYATIQKSHGGTLRSLQLRGLQQGAITLGEEPGESNDYATLDHLRRPASAQGPKVPGIETPLSPMNLNSEYHELRTSFTGSTFQPPDIANRPLPDEPFAAHSQMPRNITLNAQGEPVLVAELI